MGAVLEYDQEASRRVEAMYLTPDVASTRRQVLRMLALRPGERVLDIGSGPGFLAGEMAAEVAPGGAVCGVDVSRAMLAMARARHAAHPPPTPVADALADARWLPFADGSFDAAVALQTYEYIADIPIAFAELHRVVRPGGRALLLDTDWDSIVWHSSDRARMERILAVWSGHLADPYLPRTFRPRLECAGFRVREQAVLPLFNAEGGPDAFSHWVVNLIEHYVVGRGGLTRAEVAAWVEDLRALERAGGCYFSLNRYVAVAEKPGI